MVRAAESTSDLDAMRAAGCIGLSYKSVGDARTMTAREIEYAISDSDVGDVESMRARLMRFVNDIRVGDLIVTPNTPNNEVWISLITGPYEFHEEANVPGFQHSHTAEWIGWTDRSEPWLQHKLKYIDVPAAVVELRDPDWWFEAVSARDLPKERPLRHRAKAAPPRARPRRASPAAGAAPRPPVPKEPDRVLCAGQCGLQWRVAILIDGLCPDCRGD